jgi:hypothetical protein
MPVKMFGYASSPFPSRAAYYMVKKNSSTDFAIEEVLLTGTY